MLIWPVRATSLTGEFLQHADQPTDVIGIGMRRDQDIDLRSRPTL